VKLHKKIAAFYKSHKAWTLVVALVVIIVVSISGTLAWFSAQDNIVNRFQGKSGSFDIRVVDIFSKPDTPPNAGEIVEKTVGAQNLGKDPGVVRLLVLPTLVASDGTSVLEANMTDIIIIDDLDTTNWYYCAADGYYYYKGILEPETSAPNLFTSVRLASGLGSEYEDATLKIEVKCEASGVKNYRTSWWNTADDNTPPTDAGQILIDTALQTALS